MDNLRWGVGPIPFSPLGLDYNKWYKKGSEKWRYTDDGREDGIELGPIYATLSSLW